MIMLNGFAFGLADLGVLEVFNRSILGILDKATVLQIVIH